MMLIADLYNLLSNEVQYLGSRQGSVSPDVIERKANTVIVPEKFKTDIEALERYIGHPLETGLCIKVDLAELLTVIPRERKRADAYNTLRRFLKNEFGVELIINKKTKKTMSKKVFLVGKVHEIGPATIMSVQQEIQNDLNVLTDGRKVVVSLDILNPKDIEVSFERMATDDLLKQDMINTADADVITGEGLDNFRMPEPIPRAPFGTYFNCFIDQTEFIDCYKKSARALGASRMKDIKLEITPEFAKLKLAY